MSKMVTVTLSKNQQLTEAQKQEIRKATKRPIVFDEDSPCLTSKTYHAFRKASSKRNSM